MIVGYQTHGSSEGRARAGSGERINANVTRDEHGIMVMDRMKQLSCGYGSKQAKSARKWTAGSPSFNSGQVNFGVTLFCQPHVHLRQRVASLAEVAT